MKGYDKIYKIIEEYLEGKRSLDEVNAVLKEMLEFMNDLTSDDNLLNMISYRGAANDIVDFLNSCAEDLEINDNDSNEQRKEKQLRLAAIFADLFNNIKSAVRNGDTTKSNKEEKKEVDRTACGIKKGMIMKIMKLCKDLGNDSYGFVDNGGKFISFVVDIPGCGQISWHLPKESVDCSKEYEGEVFNKTYSIPNKSFLCDELTTTDLKKLPKHIVDVMSFYNTADMNSRKDGKSKTQNNFLNSLANLTKTDREAALGVANIGGINSRGKDGQNKNHGAPGPGENGDTSGPGEDDDTSGPGEDDDTSGPGEDDDTSGPGEG